MGSPIVLYCSGKGKKHKKLPDGNDVPFLSNVANSRSGHKILHVKPENAGRERQTSPYSF